MSTHLSDVWFRVTDLEVVSGSGCTVTTAEHTPATVFHYQIAHGNDGHLCFSHEVKDGREYRIGDDDQER